MNVFRILGAIAVVAISGASFLGGYLAGDIEARKELHDDQMRSVDAAMAICQQGKSQSPLPPSISTDTHIDDSESQ